MISARDTDGEAVSPRADTCAIRHRIPAEATIDELFRLHESHAPRTNIERIFGASPLSADLDPWYLAALAEAVVARILSTLDERWVVLHSVPLGKGPMDIDHLLIGPGGVLPITTKNHSGKRVRVTDSTIVVPGEPAAFTRSSVSDARRVTTALAGALPSGFEVTPLVVIVEPASISRSGDPSIVPILHSRDLLAWLGGREPVLSADDVRRIADAAADPESWRIVEVDVPDRTNSAALKDQFADLVRSIDRARARRSGWVLVGLSGVAAIVWMAPIFGTLQS